MIFKQGMSWKDNGVQRLVEEVIGGWRLEAFWKADPFGLEGTLQVYPD